MNSDRNTLFTFFTPQYVTQHRKNEAALNHTPYAKYFTDDLEVPCDMVQALKLAPLPESSLFPSTKAGLNALFQSPYDLPVAGFGLIGNKDTGRIICSWSRHFFPGATSEMLRWWFTWHMGHTDRYSLWSPYAHIGNTVPHLDRIDDPNRSYEEKMYDPENPNRVTELVGDMVLDALIHFTDPKKLGLTEETIKKGGYTFSASGWSENLAAPGLPAGMMFHLGREVSGGLELISHYWLGTHRGMAELTGMKDEVERALSLAKPVPDEMLLRGGYDMSVHDMIEFTRLSQILPNLYAEFRNA